MKTRIAVATLGLFAVIAAMILIYLLDTRRHNAQLIAQAETHNAQLMAQVETHNAQLIAQTAEHIAQLAAQTARHNEQLLALTAEFQKERNRVPDQDNNPKR